MGGEERIRPPVPDILGLVKGAEFVGKGRIELQRELWAEKRRAAFPELRADLAIIDKDKEFYLDLPYLGVDEESLAFASSWVPRVDTTTGAIYRSRFQTPSLVDPDRHVAFAGRRFREGTPLDTIPESWEVTLLVPQRIRKGLEAGMRQSDEIHHDYGPRGVEQAKIYAVLAQIYSSTEVFLRGEVKNEDLVRLAKETEKTLREEGLIGVRDSIWKRIVNYTLRAATRDIRNRINPGRSRILTRAAYLAVTDKELIMREVQKKAGKIYAYLGRIRAITRQTLTQVANIIEQEMDNPVLHTQERWLKPRTALGISYKLRAASSILEGVQAAPYLLPASEVQAILVGKIGRSPKEIETLSSRLEVGGGSSLRELKRDSVEEYLRRRDAYSSWQRMGQGLARIQAVLADPAHLETTVF